MCQASQKVLQVLIDFINNVLSTNATYGRQNRPPASYAKIEEVMANRVWSRGINREKCQAGRDPWSATPDRWRIPKTETQSAPEETRSQPGSKRGQNNGKRGKGPGSVKGKSQKAEGNHCRGFNSAAGCSMSSAQCKYKHACSRSIDSNRYCNKTDHNADGHT